MLPEELVWVPAHPSYPDDGGFTYSEMLKAVRQQRHWAFIRVPKEPGRPAVLHFYAAEDVPLDDLARMLGHELGHISGEILDDGAEEEARADRYGTVAAKVFEMLTSMGRKSSRKTFRGGKVSRQTRVGGKQGDARRSSPTPNTTPAVQVRKRRSRG